MKTHKKVIIFDIFSVIIAYFIFAISLLAINIIKYQMIKLGFYFLLIISGLMLIYNIYIFNKDMKK